ncbi:hypothetical protein AGIG_G21054 [Arapaima gigas]
MEPDWTFLHPGRRYKHPPGLLLSGTYTPPGLPVVLSTCTLTTGKGTSCIRLQFGWNSALTTYAGRHCDELTARAQE